MKGGEIMPTAQKAQVIDDLEQKLRDSRGAVLLNYRGLNMKDITALRRTLSEEHVEFVVAKNTLLRIAADRAHIDISPELTEGPTAIAFGMADEVAPARLLRDFVRRNRVVSIKGGLVGGHSMTADQVDRLAELPPKQVLLAQLLGAFQAPLSQTLGVLQAPVREVAGLAQALLDKQQGTAEAA
jgi:large subunit ribosomal protein L10